MNICRIILCAYIYGFFVLYNTILYYMRINNSPGSATAADSVACIYRVIGEWRVYSIAMRSLQFFSNRSVHTGICIINYYTYYYILHTASHCMYLYIIRERYIKTRIIIKLYSIARIHHFTINPRRIQYKLPAPLVPAQGASV